MNRPRFTQYIDIVDRAIEEDLGRGDITTECLALGDTDITGVIDVREDGVVAGIFVAEAVFKMIDPDIEFETLAQEGELLRAGTRLAVVKGKAASLLAGERVALNFLQRLSGIASLTYRFVRAVKNTDAVIADTRKTTPGLRILEKYAVRAGGANNHRFCLDDAILLKDNHIDLAGGIPEAVLRVRERASHTMKIEVETRNMEEVREAVDACVDIIMLDNFKLLQIEEAVKFINRRAIIEVSGNVNLINVNEIAMLGVDVISVGALTHSPDALDIGLNFEGEK